MRRGLGFGFGRLRGGLGVHPLADLFANGEKGDLWRYDTPHMNLSGPTILSATGVIKGRVAVNGATGSPQITTISGREAANYDGLQDRLEYDFGEIIPQPGTLILSMNGYAANANQILVSGNDTTNRWQLSVDSSVRLVAVTGGTTLLSGRLGPLEKAVIAFEVNSVNSKIWVNCSLMVTGDAGSAGMDFLSIGAFGGDGSFGWTGAGYSLLAINRLLTQGAGGELDRAMRYMGNDGGNNWTPGWWQALHNSALGTNSGGWNGFTWRIRLPAASLADISGALARIGLQAGTGESVTVTKAYIGLESGGSFQYASPPVPITWDGGNAATTIAAGVRKMSDGVALPLDGTATVVISLYMNGGTGSDNFSISSTMNGLTTQFKSGVDEAALVGALSGYTAQNAAHPVARLEVA